MDASSAVVATRAINMSGPLTETTGSEGEDSVEAALEKPLTAEEYAQAALEKLFASPLFASSVSMWFSFFLSFVSGD